MENMKMEDVTRRYSVYITDQSRTENLSGVLFYQGGIVCLSLPVLMK